MAIKFNEFNNGYNNYNFAIGQQAFKEAKKAEAESVVKRLLASGMSADEILEKLK